MEDGILLQEWAGLRVGDIITSYHSGYHRLMEIKYRAPYTHHSGKEFTPAPLVTTSKILTQNFAKSSGIKTCDISYCKKVDLARLKEMTEKFLANMEILKSYL